MASVTSLALVDSRRVSQHVVAATLSWTIRSLAKVRKAAKERQRVTSKPISIPHPPAGVTAAAAQDGIVGAAMVVTDATELPGTSSQWRVILIPKGHKEMQAPLDDEDETTGEARPPTDENPSAAIALYRPEFAIECLAPIDGQADAAALEGFRCHCVATSDNEAGEHEASTQCMDETADGAFIARIVSLFTATEFDAIAETLHITVSLEILEVGHSDSAVGGRLFDTLAAQLTRVVAVPLAVGASASHAVPVGATDGHHNRDASLASNVTVMDPFSPPKHVPGGGVDGSDQLHALSHGTVDSAGLGSPDLTAVASARRQHTDEDLAAAAVWNRWFAVLSMDGAPFPEAWRGDEFAWCSLCGGLAHVMATCAPASASVCFADALEEQRAVLAALASTDDAAAVRRGPFEALPMDGNIDESLVDGVGRAREAFPALKACGSSGWFWMQYLFVVRVAAVAGPSNVEQVLSLLNLSRRPIGDSATVPSPSEVAQRCVALLSPSTALRVVNLPAWRHRPGHSVVAGSVIEQQLSLLADMKQQAARIAWGSDVEFDLTKSIASVRGAVDAWREDYKRAEDHLADSQRRRAQLTAAVPYRQALSSLRASADAAARDAASLPAIDKVISEVSRVLDALVNMEGVINHSAGDSGSLDSR